MTDEKRIFLPIVFHFHQPVDNYDFVFEDCFEKSYKPLVENLFKYPQVKVTLHFSGNLLEWFLDNKPDYIKILKQMAKRGQIEIIGGGYYEPIYAIIPYRDKIAQMNMLSNLIKEEFGLEVKGAWLSERVWEPNYPSFLHDVGLQYVIVDDNHFKSTGIIEEDTLYSYITEDEGKTIRIFPINEKLRYLIPWKPTYMSIEYLQTLADKNGDRMALLTSDAEKMGVWGTTHQFCYVEGLGHQEGDNGKPFIPAFLEQIVKNDWIKSITLSEYMNKYPPKGLIYLPTASYDKMEAWVLPKNIRKKFEEIMEDFETDESKMDLYQFLKGGFWRNFLVKYPESNNMHKKMLYVREKLIDIEKILLKLNQTELKSDNLYIEFEKETGKHAIWQDKETQSFLKWKLNKKEILSKSLQIEKIWVEIYKAQCNDSYWHGLFGGVYLQFLRFSVYTHLINAENFMDQILTRLNPDFKSTINIKSMDFSKNGKLEYLLESNIFNLYLNPSDGGTIFELDYKPKSYNLLNTLTRWPESYHEEDQIESGEVMVDRFRKSMLRIRVLSKDVTLPQIEADQYNELGSFINSDSKITKQEINNNSAFLEIIQVGEIKDPSTYDIITAKIRKIITIKDNLLDIDIKLSIGKTGIKEDVLKNILNEVDLGIDLPFFFNGDPNKFQWESNQVLLKEKEKNELVEPFEYLGTHFKAYDESYDLTFEIELSNTLNSNSDPFMMLKFPIITYAFTDEDFKKIYQGITLFPRIKLSQNLNFKIKIKIT